MNNEVHDESKAGYEGVTKDVSLWKRSEKKPSKIVDGNKIPISVSIASLYNVHFHYEENMLTYLYQKWISLEGNY